MDDLLEWLKAAIRWTHVFAGILWIGQTWLFHWFDKNLVRSSEDGKLSMGKVWMVHGGHMFLVEKQHYPEKLPQVLHWFKWESFLTWLTGMVLLVLTYYMGGLLIEPEQNFNIAIGVAVALFLGGWLVYDVLVRTPLGKNSYLFGALSWVVLVALAYFLRRWMSPRAVYIHIAMMMGTIMVSNVWMRILPSQRKMLALAREGKPIDPKLGELGPTRSKHNSFIVMPLVFMMISNHYPTISYGNDYSWAIFGGTVLVGWFMAHVVREGGFSFLYKSSTQTG